MDYRRNRLGGLLIAARFICVLIILATPVLVADIANGQAADPAKPAQQGTSSSPAPEIQVQQGPPVAPRAADQQPEISTQEATVSFQVRVNLVEVRVVVRDNNGNPVTGLKQEDFQLFDNGKPQKISRFSVEETKSQPAVHHDEANNAQATEAAKPAGPTASTPQRYVAYLFDDVHLDFGSISRARTAAENYLQTLQPTDRAAIYSISGQHQTDFTDDHAALLDGLNRISPHPISSNINATNDCPQMTYYMADQIVNHQDGEALAIATDDAVDCAYSQSDPASAAWLGPAAKRSAENAARQKLHLGSYETQVTLDTLRRVVRRMTAMPGQRTIILVSPGFLNPEQHNDELKIEEQALHAHIVINTLDARGLYTEGLNATVGTRPRHKQSIQDGVDSHYAEYAHRALSAQNDVMRELADATGGKFFHNSNDMCLGFKELSDADEYAYLLAFSPANLKLDGSFHTLKIALPGRKYDIHARNGYYAPKGTMSATEQARRELEDEVFSQEELHDIPVQLHTEFFKSSDEAATLSVLVRVDARPLQFQKVDGRNRNDITVISALFDRNGKFITGTEKVLQMRLLDQTLGSKLLSGLTLKSSFDVKPGSYLVRTVVSDENRHMAAESDAVDIP